MLQSVREERSRHLRLALRIGIPVLIFVFLLAYTIFFHVKSVTVTGTSIALFAAMFFVIIYFIYSVLELGTRETLLDRVTGGYHYAAFLRRVARKKPKTLAAVLINNLSAINENFGVARADHILRELVSALDTELLPQLDPEGYIGRKTGAELLLALDVEPESAEAMLERFVRERNEVDGVEVELVFAVIRNNIDDPDKALEQLRDLLARRTCLPEREGTSRSVPDALNLSREERKVVEALESGSLALSFRPLLNLHSNRRDIYEVGVRMVTREGTRILPRDFLPIINRHDLGQRYDRLIFRKLLELAALVGEEISFSFNLSPYSLRNEEFLKLFLEDLERSNISSRRLIVELYERRRHHRLEEYLEDLRRIKQHGIRLCLDNFGSSNASMEYLRHFPFDMIQFDRDYTRDLESGKSLPLLKSFVTMAKEMGMLTVAKWVDDTHKIEILRSIDVDYVQGYAAGRVLDESEFLQTHNPIEKG